MWMVWFGCAVVRPGPVERPPDVTTEPSTTGGDSTPVSGDSGLPAEEETPLVDEALEPICPDPVLGERFPVGDDLARVTLAGAGRCNDGSAPVLYVRRATDPTHADDWVWRFDGGSYCADADSCAARWCGTHYPYGLRHMSSRPYPAAIGGIGISADRVDNTFRSWNQVFAAYCTSDAWRGERADVDLAGDPSFRLHFEGAVVARDGIAAGVAGLVSDDGVVHLRSLALARNILVAGTSAGCQGAAAHSPAFQTAAKDALVTTVLDSCFDAAPEVLDDETAQAMESDLALFWDESARRVWGARANPVCAADHPDDEWRCAGLDLQIREYLPRVFVHHDLADPVVFRAYASLGMSPYEYAAAAIDTFRTYQATVPQVSIHANTCSEHTSIDQTVPFLFTTVVDAEDGGPPMSFHDTLAASLTGRQVVVVDDGQATGSACHR